MGIYGLPLLPHYAILTYLSYHSLYTRLIVSPPTKHALQHSPTLSDHDRPPAPRPRPRPPRFSGP